MILVKLSTKQKWRHDPVRIPWLGPTAVREVGVDGCRTNRDLEREGFKLFGITSYGDSCGCWGNSLPVSLETHCENDKTKVAMIIFTVRVKSERGKSHIILVLGFSQCVGPATYFQLPHSGNQHNVF